MGEMEEPFLGDFKTMLWLKQGSDFPSIQNLNQPWNKLQCITHVYLKEKVQGKLIYNTGGRNGHNFGMLMIFVCQYYPCKYVLKVVSLFNVFNVSWDLI